MKFYYKERIKAVYVHDTDTHNTNAASHILPHVFSYITPESIVDYGCGLGSWLNVAKQLAGARILGIDGSHVDRSMLYIDDNSFMTADLEKRNYLPDKYDPAICLEVAEHISKENEKRFIETLISFSDTILFSAAIPGQGGQNHINEQWQEYWVEVLLSYGYKSYSILDEKLRCSDSIEWWYRQNHCCPK